MGLYKERVRDPEGKLTHELHPSWYLDYYDADGIRRRESSGTTSRTKAQRKLEDIRAKVRDQKAGIDRPEPTKLTFKQFAEEFDRLHVSHKKSAKDDRQRMKTHLIPAFGSRRMGTITRRDIETFKALAAKKVSRSTTNRLLSLLKTAFGKAADWGYVKTNPVRGVRLFKEQPRERVLSPDEETRLLAACRADLRTFVVVAIHSGMRSGEITSLTWDQIDFDQKLVLLLRTKTAESRRVPLNRCALEALTEWKKDSRTKRVFPNLRNNLRRTWIAACKQAKIPTAKTNDQRLTPHDLRRTFVTRCLRQGVDLSTLMAITGHREIETLSRYMVPDSVADAVSRLEDASPDPA